MAFVTIDPFTSGQVLTAAQMNEIGDDINIVRDSQVNIVSTFKESVFSSASLHTTFQDVTGLSASITPSATTSKVLVTAVISCGSSGGSDHIMFNLRRGSTNIAQPTTSGGSFPSTAGFSFTSTAQVGTLTICFLDSPSTTSATTYSVQGRNSSNVQFFVNQRGDGSTRQVSSITVQEIPV